MGSLIKRDRIKRELKVYPFLQGRLQQCFSTTVPLSESVKIKRLFHFYNIFGCWCGIISMSKICSGSKKVKKKKRKSPQFTTGHKPSWASTLTPHAITGAQFLSTVVTSHLSRFWDFLDSGLGVGRPAGSLADIIPTCGSGRRPLWWCWYRSGADAQLLFMMWLAQVDAPWPQVNQTPNPQIYSPQSAPSQLCLSWSAIQAGPTPVQSNHWSLKEMGNVNFLEKRFNGILIFYTIFHKDIFTCLLAYIYMLVSNHYACLAKIFSKISSWCFQAIKSLCTYN